MSIVGGAGRFNHNVGWSELGVIWSKDAVGLKVDTIFTVCPRGERGEGPGDIQSIDIQSIERTLSVRGTTRKLSAPFERTFPHDARIRLSVVSKRKVKDGKKEIVVLHKLELKI